jgi:hypothetical protein
MKPWVSLLIGGVGVLATAVAIILREADWLTLIGGVACFAILVYGCFKLGRRGSLARGGITNDSVALVRPNLKPLK